MAQIKRYIFINRLRAESSGYIQHFSKGKVMRSGRGLSFWFSPDEASISEIPMDDRELTFMVKGQSADYQDIAVQGILSWRVADAVRLAERVDFSINLRNGALTGQPETQIRSILNGLIGEFSDTYLKKSGVRELLENGLSPLQGAINAGFSSDPTLNQMGLEIVSVRISALTPSPELSRALQAPTFESLQQKADEATFGRRALAVEKERAIAENELSNQVELAARKQELIAREDENARSEAEAMSAAQKIMGDADAEAKIVAAKAEATRIREVEQASADMESARMQAYSSIPPAALYAMAAQEFAGKLEKIDSLTISPDMLSGLMSQVKSIIGKEEVKSTS